MPPYVPDGDPSCFPRSAVAQSRGEISIDQYLDNVLPHLSGVVHPEAACSREKMQYHPLSMTIQSCLFESNFVILEDTASIKKLLLSCWNGDLEDVRRETPQLLNMLEAHGIARNIFETMLCIACIRKNLALLQYCLTLDYNASELISKSPPTPTPIKNATTGAPDLEIWRLLIENGLLGQQAGEMRQRLLNSLAMTAIKADLPRVELLQDLSRHGLAISDMLLNVAAQKTDPDTMRYLVSKCSLQDLERSNALLMAAAFNKRLIELLLDSGMNVNAEGSAPKDPFDFRASTTPLHNAAEKGDMDAVKLLLARGASWTKRDDQMKTAADRAEENGHQEVADFIRKSEW